ARGREVEARDCGKDRDDEPARARAARQARYRADLCAGRRARGEAAERDPELDQVHRRQGHQGGMTRMPCVPGAAQRAAKRSGAPQTRDPSLSESGSRVCGASLRAAPRPGARTTGETMTLLVRCLVIAAALALAVPASAAAQDFAGKPIRIIVALVAGGVTARLVAQKLTDSLHANAYVDNRPGGLFIPATRELINAEPDGHTLLMISTSNVVTQPLHADYPVDLRALTPVTEVSDGPLILVARKDLPIRSVADLVAYATANPGKLTFGSGGGTGSSLYLAAELLRLKTGIKFQHVPYRGAAAALNDLLGAHIDLMFDA